MIKLINPNSFEPKLIWSAIAGVGSAIGGALFNSHESDKARAWQTSEREAAQQYNTSERVASQQWQDMQRVAQNQYAEDMYNKYQSPQAMINQYKAAGINPAAVVGQATGGSMNATSGSSGGAPSGSHVGTPGTSVPFQDVGAWANSFSSVANALKSLGEAKKLNIDTKYYEREMLARIRGKELESDLLALKLDVEKIYAKPMARAAYDKLTAEIAKTNMDVQVAEKQVDILVSQGQMAKDEAEQFKEQLRLNRLKTSSEINEINKRADLHVADIDVRNVEKNLVKAKTQTEYTTSAMQKSMKKLYQNEAAIKFIDAKIKRANSEQEVRTIFNELKQRELGAYREIVPLFDYWLDHQDGITSRSKGEKFWDWLGDQRRLF